MKGKGLFVKEWGCVSFQILFFIETVHSLFIYSHERKAGKASTKHMGWGVWFASKASKKIGEAVDIFGKQVNLLGSSPCYHLDNTSFTT